jgi:hypothetical protein
MALKNLSANCFRKFKRLQLTFQVVTSLTSSALDWGGRPVVGVPQHTVKHLSKLLSVSVVVAGEAVVAWHGAVKRSGGAWCRACPVGE